MSINAESLAAALLPQPVAQHEFIAMPFPEQIWSILESLYASAYSSRALLMPQCEASSETAQAWVEQTNGKISALLLFTREGPLVRVLNQVVSLPVSVLQRFARDLFAHDPQAQMVQLHAVFLDTDERKLPRFASAFSEDYVLTLPTHVDAWLAALSRQTREKVRYYLRRAFRRQPDLLFDVTSGRDIPEPDVRRVLGLNRQRMQRKRKAFGMSAAEETQLCLQMQQAGMLFTLRIDGEICAGLLCSVTGREVYMQVIAHDPAQDDLRLGLVCCCLAIRHSIEQGFSRFHFLWGHYDYKRRLGGRAHTLYRVMVPRNVWQLLWHPVYTATWLADTARDAMRRWRRPAVARECRC